MNRRSMTGLLVLFVLITSVLYLWQPWRGAADAPLKLGLDLQGGLRVVLQTDEATPAPEDLQAARSVIENRVNAFGVAEPLVQTSGENRIIVELPGLATADTQRALDLIGQQAVLEFRMVKTDAPDAYDVTNLEPPAFTGEILQNAQANFNRGPDGASLGGAVVHFEIKRAHAQAFGDFTTEHIGRQMAIVLDGKVMSAPTIQTRIADQGQITGMADLTEATDLALVLRSGSLPLSWRVEETRSVGPTLGADAIHAGALAGGVGALAVVVSILLYYGPLFGGLLALGLIYALLMIFGVLAGLGATLTLPGLAGLVLTIGAAVDGNVISFERIKEELRAGKGLRLAMKTGFHNSLPAIIDANVTTLLAAAALYQYTSGPVRGFAITLAIGIVASVFVNTVAVPFALEVLTLRFRQPLLPQGIRVPSIAFMRMAPAVITLSAVLTLGALALMVVKPLKLSTDFTGGAQILLHVPQETGVDTLRAAIDAAGLSGGSATIQEINLDAGLAGEAIKAVSIRLGPAVNGVSAEMLPSAVATAVRGQVLQADFVGPAVGTDLRSGALMAMLVAFGLILAYVACRFWPNYIVAIAAIATSLHDVSIVLGVLNLVNAEFSIPVLAALLFVVGYSLNDSIIVADCIRENLRRMRAVDYATIVNLAINQTLSRTIMTSATTLLPVIALLLFGGEVLRAFSLTLLIGIGFGTYSSIFVMAPMIVWFKSRQSIMRKGPVGQAV